jgi:hypothetical protein
VKGILRFTIAMLAVPFVCGTAFVIGYVILVALTIPQLPAWAQKSVTDWMLDIPQHSESADNGSRPPSSAAGISAVRWAEYVGSKSSVHGMPMKGPIQTDTWRQTVAGLCLSRSSYGDHNELTCL